MSNFESDCLAGTSAKRISNNLFKVINPIQDEPREVQVLTLASLFILIVEEYGVSPNTALQVAENMLNDRSKPVEFNAAKDYVQYVVRQHKAPQY